MSRQSELPTATGTRQADGDAAGTETRHPAHLHRMARAGGLSMVGAGISAICGVALVAVITNGLPKDLAGTIFATTSLFLIATAIVQMGTDTGLVRWLPAQMVTGKVTDVVPTLRVAMVPVTTLSLLAAGVVLVIAPDVAELVAGPEHADTVAAQLRVLAVFLPLTALYNITLAASRGFRTMLPTVAVESIGRSVVQIAAIAAAQILGLGAVGVVLAWSLPYAAAFTVAAVWLFVLIRRMKGRASTRRQRTSPPDSDTSTASPAGPPERSLTAQFWSFTAPRAIATMSQTLLKRFDIVLVAALRSPADAALYTAATRFVTFGQLGVQALQQALAPQLSALFARKEYDSAQDLYKTTTAWSMMLAWPVYLGCAVLATSLLRFFGAGYSSAAAVVVVLSLTMLMATASGFVDTVLLMSGRSWLSLANVGTALAVNIGLNLVLIRWYGILGAAISWAVAIVIRNALPLIEIKFLLGMSPLGSGTVWVALSAAGCFGIIPGALRIAGASTPVTLGALIAGAVAYLVLIWLGRERLNLSAFRGVVRRRISKNAEAETPEAVTVSSGPDRD